MANLKSLAKDTAIYGLSSIVGRFLNYLLVPLYTNYMPKASGDYGISTNVYAYTALILVLLTFGMETTLFRFANKAPSHLPPLGEASAAPTPPLQLEETWADTVFSTAFATVAALTGLFLVLVFGFIDPISSVLHYTAHPDYLQMMAVVVALDALQAIPFSYLRFQKRPIRFASLKMLFIFLNIGLNVFYFVVLGKTSVFYVFFINLLCTGFITLFFIPDLFRIRWHFDGQLLRQMLSYSWPILILGIAGILNQVADKILFPLVYPDEAEANVQLGVYGSCVKIAMIMAMITQAFRYAYEPIVFAKSKDGDKAEYYAAAMKYFLIFTLLAFLCVVGWMPVLQYIIGEDYREGLGVVPIVMVAEIMMGVYFNLSFWYKLIDKTIYGAWFSLAGCLVLFAVNILFIPKYGYWACAWGGVAGYGTAMVLSYIVGQKKNPIPYPMKDIIAYVAMTAVFTALMYATAHLPAWAQLVFNTIFIIAFVAFIIKRDLPLSSLPVIGKKFRKNAMLVLLLLTAGTISVDAASPLHLFGKKKQTATETEKPASKYQQLTGRDSVEMKSVMNVIGQGDTIYLELPVRLLGRVFLVSNKLQQVQSEMNEAGVNRGINYQNQCIRFEWNRKAGNLLVRQQRLTPEAPSNSAIARSVADNYIDPIIASLKVEAVASDSSTIVFKVSDLFNGRKNILNDVFNETNIGTSPVSELSRILSVKGYDNSVVALSELTTTVHEGKDHVNVTVVVSTAISLLPEQLMSRRLEDWRVGYFTTPATCYDDQQQQVKHQNYITRWRLEPNDTAAYLRGELTEPVKPIVFYIDKAVPERIRPYIKKGITDWNRAFERAGFKNAVRAMDLPDSIAANDGDDLRYSVLTYAASEKANAMGPSTLDPRTGEILEADIIWWHNVQSLIREWVMVQTGAVNPKARSLELPTELIGDAVRFVACHEVGHSLGLRHNMIASAAYPTDSLRSPSFTRRMGGTSASIMDYARFNYVAQPEDGVEVMSPGIGPYDLMAIEWGYRWYPAGTNERQVLEQFLARHSGREYRYSESQPQRSAVDPRALSEDLGDDPIRSARLGIANLKRVMPHLVDWTRTGEPGQNYDEAANLYSGVIFQWGLYLYHVMANVGGMYLERPTIDNGVKGYTFVEKNRQRQAVQFLIDEVLCYPRWLFDTPLTKQIYPLRKTPNGVNEQEPQLLLRNQQNYILWDLLENERLVRMYENELQNGSSAFTAVEMMQMLHNSIFQKTIKGQSPNVMERSLQKSFVDALITAAAESESVKINKKLTTDANRYQADDCTLASGTSRTIDVTSSQISRTSDALSVKRGELLCILRLLKNQRKSGDLSSQMHYEDVILRIQTALGLSK